MWPSNTTSPLNTMVEVLQSPLGGYLWHHVYSHETGWAETQTEAEHLASICTYLNPDITDWR